MSALRERLGPAFTAIEIAAGDLSLDEAVATYLFNSQLLLGPDGRLLLVAPQECRDHPRASRCIDALVARGGPIAEVMTFDLRQSMRNGGGPACLRLRVELAEDERRAIGANVFLDDALADALEDWVRRHYRDRIAPGDLADPALLQESRRALDELTAILRLPSIYPFQRTGA
jgi:succinylarginine dihydrolase